MKTLLTLAFVALGQAEIGTRADLEAIDLAGHCVLTADIDLSDAPWTPLGPFTGTFDGRGHTISGLDVCVPDGDDLGLFSTAEDATFLRLHVSGVVSGVDLGDRMGLLLGRGTNVLIRDVHAAGDVRGRYFMGTLAGELISSTVLDCSATGNVGDASSFTYGHMGGLVGSITIGVVERCSFSGLVSTRYGPVIGSLIGTIYGSTVVRDCYAHGCVVDHYGEPSVFTSALVGSATEAEVTRCYTTACVINSFQIGAIAGYAGQPDGVSDCYWDAELSGVASACSDWTPCVGAEPKTTAEMQFIKTYVGWDFEAVWNITLDAYPHLRQWCPWDLDRDGDVGIPDFLTVLGNWGPCTDCENCPGDTDENCDVGIGDFIALLGHWGACQ